MPADTLVGRLLDAVNAVPDTVIFTYLEDGDLVERRVTVRDLHARASAAARVLNDRGLRGTPVLLLMNSSVEFIVGFVSCLYAGALAVTAFPPNRRSEARLRAVVRDSGAKAVVSTQSIRQDFGRPKWRETDLEGALPWICVDDAVGPDEDGFSGLDVPRSDDIAFLQYTSGSTGNPRGVIVRHGNLISNLRMIHESFGMPEELRLMSWLPMQHDMGLIGGVLLPIYLTQPAVLISPFHFLQQPLRWMRAISRFRSTVSAAPNFAYDLCSRRATADDVRDLDLSAWTLALNGSEPISGHVLDRFCEVFAPAGFRESSFFPCYGLAEATLLVSGERSQGRPTRIVADARALAAGRIDTNPSGESRVVLSCGRIHPAEDVRIVDVESLTEAAADQVGEIWVTGPNVAAGYWRRPEESEATFGARMRDSDAGPFLRTGDLGFRRGDELYVCGRFKDLIIVRGRNIDPFDIEETVRDLHVGRSLPGVAAFDSNGGLVVSCETRSGHTRDEHEQLAERIRTAIASDHSVQVTSIVFLRAGRMPKTTSGKVQRHAARRMFEAGEEELFRSTSSVEARESEGAAPPAATVQASSRANRESERQHLMHWMSSRVAARLGRSHRAIDVRAPLSELGLDSMALVELSGELERRIGTKVSPSLLYAYPSIEALTSALLADADGSCAPLATPPQGPVAVIGMACRFPGGSNSPEEYWRLLLEGRDGVDGLEHARGSVPGDFSHLAPLLRRMGAIENPSAFDPDFFNISERDARCMDPQQQLLLLTSWQALEHASIDPSRLRGRAVGVFCGLSSTDHVQVLRDAGGVKLGSAGALGAAASIAAGRISYQLGLRGPSLTVDTACSSSLLAVHLACQSLRSGESELALAGGANVIQSSESTIALWSMGALSPTGRCSAFSADADGYVRGEGAGMLVLKPLERALADGDPVLAVLHGSAANHDGDSNGLTAPSGIAQRALIEEALARAGVESGAVGFVETHGTGTHLGDPIEADALRGAFRLVETQSRLLIGSCKTNIGHLEAAAGIAGLTKVVLALQHGTVPPNLHFARPHPGIDWKAFTVPTEPLAWPAGKPYAGVSSFGLSGTNVHLVVGPAPAVSRPASDEATDVSREYALPLSARTHGELACFADALAGRLERDPNLSLTDLATALVHGRRRFDERAVVAVRGTPAEARTKTLNALRFLSAADEREQTSGVVRGRASGRNGDVVLLFTGQGAQQAGAGRELYERWPRFREVIDRCHQLLQEEEGFGLRPLLFEGMSGDASLDDTRYTQPALFALQMAIAALWESFGVRPSAVLGHSVGEIAAASIAGVMSEADGLRMAALRGRLMSAAPGDGAMLSVRAAVGQLEEVIQQVLAGCPGPLSIACYNGPSQQTVAGGGAAIAALASRLERLGIAASRLRVSHAFHSDLMKPVVEQFGNGLASIELRASAIAFVSSLDGELVGQRAATREYWQAQLRSPVRFQTAVEAARRFLPDTNCWIEVGPDPVLSGLVRSILQTAAPTCVPSRRSLGDERLRFLEAVASVDLIAGADLSPLHPPSPRRPGIFPSYPFNLRTFSVTKADAAGSETPGSDIHYRIEWEMLPPQTPPALASAFNPLWVIGGSDRQRACACAALERAHIPSIRLERVPAADCLPSEMPSEVLWLDGMSSPGAERMLTNLADALRDLRRLPGGPARIRVITRGAVPVGAVANPDAAALWGFGKSAALELPGQWAGLVDIDSESDGAWDALARWLATQSNEDQVALRGDSVHVPRLVAMSRPDATWRPPSGASLLIGGLGRIGLQLAEWLIGKGVTHLVLTTTRRLPSRENELAKLERQGVTIDVERVDLGDATSVEALFARLRASGVRVGSVFQLAGVCDRMAAADVGAHEFQRALSPKLTGSRALREHLREFAPDCCVAFTSVSAVWGSAELSAYAAANASLDAWAALEENASTWQSVAWGPWLGSGMVSEQDSSLFERMGLRPLTPARAFAALDRILATRASGAIVANLDRPRFCAALQARREMPLLARLDAKPQHAATAPWVAELSGLAPPVRRVRLIERLRTELARVLTTDPHAIDARRGFQEQGVDSLMVAELRAWIERSIGRTIPTTLLFESPNLEALAEKLLETLGDVQATPDSAPATQAKPAEEPIAIVGMGCRFPGGADDPERFWSLIAAKRDVVQQVPAARWGGSMASESEGLGPFYGSFIDDVDKFDAAFFRISATEARTLDPQQRLVLETTWHALENAGIAPDSLRGSRTGAFIGIGVGDYQRLIERSGEVDRHAGTGTNFCFSAGRLSHTLGLEGPSMAVDTACSSSLMAVHLACQSLREGESRIALAGGVNLMLTGDAWLFLAKSAALAKDGRSKTFSASADGYGRGEGCGVVVLKRLSDAQADGDRILAVIKSTSVNHDGASGGLTVPNVAAQRKLLTRALERAGARADDVAYLEAHGTGTRLGDPIELAAAADAYGLERRAGTPLYVGSVKTNIGHLEAAAGIAGIIKVILAMNRRVIPPQRTFGEANPEVPWQRLNVEVAASERVWPGERPLAGVSAFGLSGTNAHVLLGPPPVANAQPAQPRPDSSHRRQPWRSALLLSAASSESLHGLATRWADWLSRPDRPEWTSTCAAAATGRAHLSRRIAVLADPGATSPIDAVVEALRAGSPRDASPWLGVGRWSEAAPPRPLLVLTEGTLPEQTVARLTEASERFRETFARCVESYREEWPNTPPAELSEEVRTVLVALSLIELWRSWGVTPAYVFSHGYMELAGACAASALSAEQAARCRSLLDQPRDANTVSRLERILTGNTVTAAVPAFSPAQPASVETRYRDPRYWLDAVTDCRAEQDAFERILGMEAGPEIVLHLGPTSHWLANLVARAWEERPLVDATFSADVDPAEQIARALCSYHVAGGSIDWAAVHGASERIDLPLYPFERRRHWIDAKPAGQRTTDMASTSEPVADSDEPRLFGAPAMLPMGRERHFSGELSLGRFPFLVDHKVYGRVVVPGAFHVAAMLTAARDLHDASDLVLENVLFRHAIVFEESERYDYRLVASEQQSGVFRLDIYFRVPPASEYRVVAEAMLGFDSTHTLTALDLNHDRLEAITHADFYDACARHALDFGPCFRWLNGLRRAPAQASAKLEPPAGIDERAGFAVHPTLVDACFQLLALAEPQGASAGIGAAYVPFAIERLVLHRAGSHGLSAKARARSANVDRSGIADTFAIDACVDNSSGERLLSIGGLFAKRALEQRVLKRDSEWEHSLHEVKWSEIAAEGPGVHRGDTVLLGPASELLAECGRVLAAAGDEHTIVLSNPEELLDTPLWWSGDPLTVVLIADRSNGTSDAMLPTRTASLLFQVARACAARAPIARLALVARGAIDFENSRGPAPELAALFGMARALATEVAALGCTRIDLDPAASAHLAARTIPAALSLAMQEPEVAWRAGKAFAPRVESVKPSTISTSTSAASGTAIVTGGFGALGGVAALALAKSGYSHIVLLGRRPEATGNSDQVVAARALEVDVVSAAVDVADRQQLAQLLSRLRTELPPIRAIVHAAGVRDDAPFEELDEERIQSVFAGKVSGAIHLDELTASDPVELFLAFGSASAWYPNAGQTAYAAANAALDAIMAARRARGKPGVCVQWGPWTTGMASGFAHAWERLGIAAWTPEQGQAVLEGFIRDQSGLPAAPVVLRATERAFDSSAARIPASGLRKMSNASTAAEDRAFRDELLGMPARARKRAAVRYLQRAVALMMGLPDHELPAVNTGLTELGLDSLMAVDLRGRLEAVLGRELSAAVALEYPTIDLLATFMVDQSGSVSQSEFRRDDAFDAISDDDLMLLLNAELENG
jgi:acyl transferase domain-containing protein/acyl-CoA synthetase (AMP-forming)/AMP-acid ligase II/acyl carrier protein